MSSTVSKEISKIVTFEGQTSGTSGAGTMNLNSDIFVTSISKFVIPKGTRMKVWSRLVAGYPVTVNYQFANDGSTFRTLVSDVVTSATGNDIDAEKRRPHVFRSYAGTEALQLTYSGSSGISTVAFDVEISEETPL